MRRGNVRHRAPEGSPKPWQFVKPFLRGQKNDFRDAEAVAEAVQRPGMRFVPTKSVDQLDLQALHLASKCKTSDWNGITLGVLFKPRKGRFA